MSSGTRGPQGPPPPADRRRFATVVLSVALLAVGLIPTAGGSRARAVLRSLHALEANRSEHEAHATGYYVGLIDGEAGPGRDELALALLGKPPGWVSFHDVGAARYLRGDFLQFELRPDLDTPVFGSRFTTNALGLRDRPCTVEKPPGVFRIALLGSSMDMGWGVGTDETYENRFEDWLNAYAARRGLSRRFEVLNFAMAAYSPLHRLEAFERKARAFRPDLVLYAATRLDTRLLQIHLVGLLQDRVDLKHDFVRRAVADAGLGPEALAVDGEGRLVEKDLVKARLEPALWPLNEAALGRLAASCRSAGVPLAVLIIPRAAESDGPASRGPDVARITSLAARLGLPLADLSGTFDDEDPGAIEIAAWDDHPNALGHRLLFLALGRSVVEDAALHRLLFDADPEGPGPPPRE